LCDLHFYHQEKIGVSVSFTNLMPKKQNTLLKILIAFTIAVVGISQVNAKYDISQDIPNVIIFLTDDVGYGDLAVYGHPVIKTPHLDRFAEEGVRMTDMHSAATVCSPSRASILTGRNAYRSGYYNIAGFFGTTLPENEISIAHLLKDAGYQTGFFGKWHLSRLESENEVSVNDMGFDYSFATTVNAFGTGPKNPVKFIRNGIPVGEVKGWYVDILVQEASEWITKSKNDGKPFFAIIATHESHTPIDPPAKYTSLYDNNKTDELSKNISYGGLARPKKDISAYKKEYYGTVTQIDDAFGNLMQLLEDQNLTDNTLVVFTSDNGPEYPVTFAESGGEWEDPIRDKCFGTPGNLRGMKRYPYEGGHRVPGLARWPGHIPAGIVSDKLFNGSDFLPTLCHLAGISLPNDRTIDGTNAFNAFKNMDYERELPPMWFFPLNYGFMPGMAHMAMRYDDYVLIGYLSPERGSYAKDQSVDWIKTAVPAKFELYNIKKDEAQKNDLSDTETDVLMKLIPVMQSRWIDIRDEGPWWGRME